MFNILKSRINYWNCSKFADFIRGEKKPHVLGLKEWQGWHDNAKQKHPIRYYVAEKLLNKIQNFFYFPLDLYSEARNYYTNRFVTKTHYLKTGLKPGVYHELDDRILHGLFNELVEFVEVEQAVLQNYGENHNGKKYKFKNRRCEEAGLDYLNWAMNLKFDDTYGLNKKDPKYGKPTPQAESAKKMFELYTWWKNRPNRPDPAEVSGWRSYCEQKEDKKSLYSPLDKKETLLYKKLEKIEQQYEKEDQKMLLELIKIRKSLWT